MDKAYIVESDEAHLREQLGKPVSTRFRTRMDAELDLWIATQPDHPSRSEAIRRLVGIGLKASAAEIDPGDVRQSIEDRFG